LILTETPYSEMEGAVENVKTPGDLDQVYISDEIYTGTSKIPKSVVQILPNQVEAPNALGSPLQAFLPIRSLALDLPIPRHHPALRLVTMINQVKPIGSMACHSPGDRRSWVG
jgi:hypothetical protein